MTEQAAREYELGARVEFTYTLHRKFRASAPRSRKVWEHEAWPGQDEPEARQGIIVGVRTLANGYLSGGYWEEPTQFEASEHFRAYLVAFDVRRRPVLVRPEHVRALS